jgi:hypothetical protein
MTMTDTEPESKDLTVDVEAEQVAQADAIRRATLQEQIDLCTEQITQLGNRQTDLDNAHTVASLALTEQAAELTALLDAAQAELDAFDTLDTDA